MNKTRNIIGSVMGGLMAELANNTKVNGLHIANLLSEHVGQYAVARSNYMQ
ncbi:MAG: hypothetical protein H7Y86_02125 [Rhizobacter sp.]|nr:hypothetical protein [Ferruginibacter sp.]